MSVTGLTWEDILEAATSLDVDPNALNAVCEVETAGAAFLPSGKPKILFEGHIFWKQLKQHGLNPEDFAARHPNIVYPRWDRTQYKGGEAEYARLEEACAIHRDAALASASWGMFQIMGFNHKACGFNTVEEFVSAHQDCAAAHLRAFSLLLRQNRWDKPLQRLDWANFARCYNGPAYAKNKYDVKLATAYENSKKKRAAEPGQA